MNVGLTDPPQKHWNDKNLDYEIETMVIWTDSTKSFTFLKRQEPRLRDWNYTYTVSGLGTPQAWNDKNLDYEIETGSWRRRSSALSKTWNDKNLDYEIETSEWLAMP